MSRSVIALVLTLVATCTCCAQELALVIPEATGSGERKCVLGGKELPLAAVPAEIRALAAKAEGKRIPLLRVRCATGQDTAEVADLLGTLSPPKKLNVTRTYPLGKLVIEVEGDDEPFPVVLATKEKDVRYQLHARPMKGRKTLIQVSYRRTFKVRDAIVIRRKGRAVSVKLTGGGLNLRNLDKWAAGLKDRTAPMSLTAEPGVPMVVTTALARHLRTKHGFGATLEPVFADSVPKVTAAIGLARGAGSRSTVRGPSFRFLRQYGGSDRTQQAVDRGLMWLARNQAEDGTWATQGNKHHVAATGLAVLALLGNGVTGLTGKSEYKAALGKALEALEKAQRADGEFGGGLNQVIATTALVEAAGVIRTERFRNSAQLALGAMPSLIKTMDGKHTFAHPELIGWAAMCSRGGKAARLSVPLNLDKALQGTIAAMTDDATGHISYPDGKGAKRWGAATAPESAHAATASVLLARMWLGTRDRAALENIADRLQKHLPVWSDGTVDTSYWHFGSLANFQLGGTHWVTWNERLKTAVLDSAKKEGDDAFSWDPIGPWGQVGGRVFSTSLAVLCMETYYRYGRVVPRPRK